MSENGVSTENAANGDAGEDEVAEHDPQYDPIISLPEVNVPTLEEDETELLNMRAKLYRYDSNEDPPEWKERGTGVVKILQHNIKKTVRVVMRRDKTLKLCANHFILPYMELKPNVSSDRAWIYSVSADYADEMPRSELLAIKFASVENANKWKDVFNNAKDTVPDEDEISEEEEEEEEEEEDEEEEIERQDSKEVENVQEKVLQEKDGVSDKLADLTLAEGTSEGVV